MKNKTKGIMKVMGATLAVCSAAAFMNSTKSGSSSSARKTMKKTVDKVADFVDTMAAMM